MGRTAVIPPVVIALLFAAASVAASDVDAPLWVAATAWGLAGAGSVGAILLGLRQARNIVGVLERQREAAEAGVCDWVLGMQSLLDAARTDLERAGSLVACDDADRVRPASQPRSDASGQEVFGRFERALRAYACETAVVLVRGSAEAKAGKQVEVFVHIARRLQNLIIRSLQEVDALVRGIEDPDLLEGLFHIDHLTTRVRRQVENLAVLGGAVPRGIQQPVSVHTLLRSALQEIEHFERVRIVPPVEGVVHGHAAADVIHLLAELVENATLFSPPDSRVELRTARVPAGIAIEVEDRGLRMPPEVRAHLQQLLAQPDAVDVQAQLRDGRIGMFVVARLAQRHAITVHLRNSRLGGNEVIVLLPHTMLADDSPPGHPCPSLVGPRGEQSSVTSTTGHAVQSLARAEHTLPSRADRRPSQPSAHGLPRLPSGSGRPAADLGVQTAGVPRPPLPRREGSYLAPQLRQLHTTARTGPPATYDPTRLASFGRAIREAEQGQGPSTVDPTT